MALAESRILNILSPLFPVSMLEPVRRSSLEKLDPEIAAAFVRACFREMKNNPGAKDALPSLFAKAEGSELSLSDWIEQIVLVYRWLDENARHAKFIDILEYVACGLQGSSLQCGHSVAWYLEHHGFEKSEGCKD